MKHFSPAAHRLAGLRCDAAGQRPARAERGAGGRPPRQYAPGGALCALSGEAAAEPAADRRGDGRCRGPTGAKSD